MVLFLLCIKAELDGVDSLSLLRNVNLCFSVRNPLNDDETRDKIAFNPSETLEQDESDREPPHHFRVKWEGSKKYSTLIVLDEERAKAALKKIKKKGKKGGDGGEIDVPRDVTSDDSEQFFRVVSEGGAAFEEDVDLSEGDWAEYDEENDCAVSISAYESKIVAI